MNATYPTYTKKSTSIACIIMTYLQLDHHRVELAKCHMHAGYQVANLCIWLLVIHDDPMPSSQQVRPYEFHGYICVKLEGTLTNMWIQLMKFSFTIVLHLISFGCHQRVCCYCIVNLSQLNLFCLFNKEYVWVLQHFPAYKLTFTTWSFVGN